MRKGACRLSHVEDRWTKAGPNGKKIRTDRHGHGLRWRAVWTEPDGTRRRKSFRTRDEAQAHLDHTAHTTRAGTYVSTDRSAITYNTWLDQWVPAQAHLKAGGRGTLEGIVRKHLRPQWGHLPLNAIEKHDVQAWLTSLDLAPATVARVHGVMLRSLNDAVDDLRLSRNPARGVNLPPKRAREMRFLTVAEVDRLIAEFTPHYRPFVRLLVLTGLRFGEAAELRVKDFSPATRRINITRSASTTTGKRVVSDPKTYAGARSVPAPDEVLADFARLSAGKGRDDLVYLTPMGAQYRKDNFRRAFLIAAHKAGLEGVRVHDLRHTTASIAIASGASVKLVQRMLGHASAAITLDVYAGLFEQELETVSARMSEYITAQRQPPHSPQE